MQLLISDLNLDELPDLIWLDKNGEVYFSLSRSDAAEPEPSFTYDAAQKLMALPAIIGARNLTVNRLNDDLRPDLALAWTPGAQNELKAFLNN